MDKSKRRMWGGVLSILVVLGGLATLLIVTRERAPEAASADRACEGGPLAVGDRIPASCIFELLDGGEATLGDIRGSKPMVINYWATWCGFCIEEMPAFDKVYRDAGGEIVFLGLDLLGIQAETKSAARRLAEETGVTYPLAFDEDGLLYFRLVPRTMMPTTIVVDAGGVIVDRQFGPITEAGLKALLQDTLGMVIG